jgi:hypothetical protein
MMDNDDIRSDPNRRTVEDRRSGVDAWSEVEKQLTGERRSGVDRRSDRRIVKADLRPSNEQLALFARRLRRALTSEKGRDFFGVVRGEYDFAIHSDVLRTVEWIENLVRSEGEETEQSVNLGKATLRKSFSRSEI